MCILYQEGSSRADQPSGGELAYSFGAEFRCQPQSCWESLEDPGVKIATLSEQHDKMLSPFALIRKSCESSDRGTTLEKVDCAFALLMDRP